MAAVAVNKSAISSSVGQAPPPLFKPASVKPRQPQAVPSLDSLPVDHTQCAKALTALLKHVEKTQDKREQDDLLGEQEEKLLLVVGLRQPAKREVHKPIRLPLPHPVIDPKVSPVTLFVKDPQREYKDLLQSSKINFISRVVGLNKLKTKHKTFEAKRALLKEADLFLVDDRVTVDVGKAIGKMWRDAKKQPIPIAIQRKDLKAELERAVAATYMQVNTGTSLAIKFGSTTLHTQAQLLDNLLALIPQIAVRIPNFDFTNVQSLHIKSTSSISLPIYNTTLDAAGRFQGPSEKEISAVAARKALKEAEKAEKAAKAEEKEKRRQERSATKEGKGRLEKEKKRKAPASEEGAEDDEIVEEVELPVTEPIVDADVGVKEKKKDKKMKKAVVETEQPAEPPKKKVKKDKKSKA